MDILQNAFENSKDWARENFLEFEETWKVADEIEYESFSTRLEELKEEDKEMEVPATGGYGPTILVNEKWYNDAKESLEREELKGNLEAYFVHELAEASLNAYGPADSAIFPSALHDRAMRVENSYREEKGLEYRGKGDTATEGTFEEEIEEDRGIIDKIVYKVKYG